MNVSSMVRSATLAVATCSLAALLTACSEDDSPAPSPESSSMSPTGGPGTTTTEGSASPSTPAATGQLVETDVVSYRLPTEQWEPMSKSGTTAGFIDLEGSGSWILTEDEIVILRPEARTLDQIAEVRGVGTSRYDPPMVRGENRVVAGVEGYTASRERINEGDRSLDESVLVWGAMRGDQEVYIELSGSKSDPRTREWFDAVLASVTWK